MGDKDGAAPQAPTLPKGLPPELEKFLTCKSEEVTVKDGTLSWISVSGKDLIPADMQGITPDKILNGKISPSLSITPDPSAPGKASIKIGVDIGPPIGVVGPSIPASIEDGALKADTSGLPQALKDQIDPAIKNLNDLFKANGYKWGTATFGSGTTKLTKVKLAPATQTTTPPPTPPPAPPKPKPAPVAPPPVTTPPVSGGCLGILFLGLAVVGIGAILFFGGPALGIFGGSGVTPTPSPTQVAAATPTPIPTPTPTPAPQVVRSSDGAVTLTIPFGSVATGTNLTVTPLGQADAPPDLAGVTFRGLFYRVGPAEATLTGPVGYERIIDLTALRIDPDKQGYPFIQLAQRTPSGQWSWLPDQAKQVGGPDGLGDETKPTQTATITTVGDVFGFSRGMYLHRDPYPVEGATFGVGQPITIGARVTGANGDALAADFRPTIANAVPTAGLIATGVVYSDPLVVDDPTRQSAAITVTCTQPGDFVVGLQMDITPKGSTELLDKLHLGGPQPTSTVAWTTSIQCVTGPPPAAESLAGGCVLVVHTPLPGGYPSHLHWLWRLIGVVPQSTLSITYHIGDSQPLAFGKIPITNGMATADTGITSYGMWQWDALIVQKPDGSTTDLTQGMLNVFGPSGTVTSAEGRLAGNECE